MMAGDITLPPLPRRAVGTVFLHCSASDRPEHDSVTVMRAWHLARGWSDVGYHFFIRKDGTLEAGRPLDRIPAAQRGHNAGSIAVCLHGLDLARFTAAQGTTLRRLAGRLQAAYAGRGVRLRFRGHCEVAAKACPVIDYRGLLGLDRDGVLPGAAAMAPVVVLRQGDRGDGVRDLQRRLAATGVVLAVDGVFGPATRRALRAFQRSAGLRPDGIAGPMTWGALAAADAQVWRRLT